MSYKVELIIRILYNHFTLSCTVIGDKTGEGMGVFVKDDLETLL